METIEFSYRFNDAGDNKEVFIRKENDVITVSECCDMFIDFMESAGFTRESVKRCLRECVEWWALAQSVSAVVL